MRTHNDNLVNRDQVRDYFLNGRRVRQAAASILPDDYVIQRELTAAVSGLQKSIAAAPGPLASAVVGSFVQASIPLATSYPEGSLVWVSDYVNFLMVVSGAWVRVLDNRYLAFFIAAPGAGWHLADGTAGVSYLKSDGTLGTLTMPTQPFYARADNAYDGPTPTAAVNPGVVNPATTGSGAAVIGANNTTFGVTAGVALVAANGHIHTDSGHTHTVANPTVSLPGDPIANMGFLAYVRL